MAKLVVTREVAEKEVEAWLDYKKVFASVREANKDSVDLLVDAVTEGHLSIDPKSFEVRHKLIDPTGDLTELVYKPRLNDRMLEPYLKGVSTKDAEGRLNAYGAALTGVVKGVFANLDSATDKKLMMAVLIFFL